MTDHLQGIFLPRSCGECIHGGASRGEEVRCEHPSWEEETDLRYIHATFAQECSDFEPKSAAAELDHGERCRCISLWQPWASLMACGAKHLETRPWNTKVRGRVCIHAAQTRTGILDLHNEACNPHDNTGLKLVVAMEKALNLPFGYWREKLPFGAIIAEGEIYDTATAAEGLARFPDQELFGDFSPGRFVHLYRDLKPITPVPFKGKQGFFFTNLPRL